MTEVAANWITTAVIVLVTGAAAVIAYCFWGWVLESNDLTTIMRFGSALLLGSYAGRNMRAIWK